MGAPGGPSIKEETVGIYAGLGGRAMTSAIVAKRGAAALPSPGDKQQTGYCARDAERQSRGDVRAIVDRV